MSSTTGAGLCSETVLEVDALLQAPPFASDPGEHHERLLRVLRSQLGNAAERSASFRNFIDYWPSSYRAAASLADLPYLPARAFKADPPLALVPREEIVRTLASSATTGQTPSRVVLDARTSKRMVKGVTTILRDFIGSQRRPFFVIDTEASLAGGPELGARGAAIQGVRPFATQTTCCLVADEAGRPRIDEAKLRDFASRFAGTESIAYGFTYVVWEYLVKPLRARGLSLEMPKLVLLHSGGWKRLQEQAVDRNEFAAGVASVLGCPPSAVIDFYGMVENVGVVYPDCECGNKHVPVFASVIVRDPLTLEPVSAGGQGLVQVLSALPTSFPGFSVLTDDIAEIVHLDGCSCGRRGICFRFIKRVPKAEIRGCGNIETARQRLTAARSLDA